MEQASLLNRLCEIILSGELKPGERVIEERLAARLGVRRCNFERAGAHAEELFQEHARRQRQSMFEEPDKD